MFYFGGMTLGYLTPPALKAKAEDGGKMASASQSPHAESAKEATLDTRNLIARANWFSLYW